MRLVIRFSRNLDSYPDLRNRIISELKKAKAKIKIIGPMNGFCVEPISWIDGYTLAANLSLIIRDHGLDSNTEIEIRVENEVDESGLSTFYNEWRGH